jgi:hypothetical protein
VPALDELDLTALARAVGRAVGNADIELGEWRCRSIHAPFNQSTGGVYRVAGTAHASHERITWSVILKVVHASADLLGAATDPSDANYWAREALLFESGVLEQLPAIRAPRCFAVDTRATTAWIWLEDVAGYADTRWTPTLYECAARRLGEFNGAYLMGRPLPATSHMSRHWLRSFVGAFAPAFDQLPHLREHPLVRRCWPGELLDQIVELWHERDVLLDVLDDLPQTFCHLDAFPRNLLIDPTTDDVVAVDWSYAGIAALGTELAPLVVAGACVGDVEPAQLGGIDATVFGGYLAGLRAGGWHGDAESARLGYAAAAALHYGLVPLGVYLVDDQLRPRFEQLFACDAAAIADRWAAISTVLLDRAEEAHRLLRNRRERGALVGCGARVVHEAFSFEHHGQLQERTEAQA